MLSHDSHGLSLPDPPALKLILLVIMHEPNADGRADSLFVPRWLYGFGRNSSTSERHSNRFVVSFVVKTAEAGSRATSGLEISASCRGIWW